MRPETPPDSGKKRTNDEGDKLCIVNIDARCFSKYFIVPKSIKGPPPSGGDNVFTEQYGQHGYPDNKAIIGRMRKLIASDAGQTNAQLTLCGSSHSRPGQDDLINQKVKGDSNQGQVGTSHPKRRNTEKYPENRCEKGCNRESHPERNAIIDG